MRRKGTTRVTVERQVRTLGRRAAVRRYERETDSDGSETIVSEFVAPRVRHVAMEEEEEEEEEEGHDVAGPM